MKYKESYITIQKLMLKMFLSEVEDESQAQRSGNQISRKFPEISDKFPEIEGTFPEISQEGGAISANVLTAGVTAATKPSLVSPSAVKSAETPLADGKIGAKLAYWHYLNHSGHLKQNLPNRDQYDRCQSADHVRSRADRAKSTPTYLREWSG